MAYLLVGCASRTAPLVDVLSGVVSEQFGPQDTLTLTAKTNPLYRYLRVEVAGRSSALLVLGYVDSHPQGDIEVWYSAKREVIKTQNGRIVSTSGLALDWRRVQFSVAPPAWAQVPAQGVVYTRLRDVMPGHQAAIQEQIELKPWLGELPLALPTTLPPAVARGYRWFREVTLGSTAQPMAPAWFAWSVSGGQPTVVYSEQCLSVNFCLKLQRWPVQESSP